jgi:predicted dehydrogenase
MAETIRVGLIGAGANTRLRHIPGLRAQDDVEIIGVANRSRESGQKAADEFGIERVYDNWLELIDDDIDAVCIGTWPYMHATTTIAAIEMGKHVLCEARMAMNSIDAHAMLEASQVNPHLTCQIVPAPHTLPIDRTVIDLISDGTIGDVLSVKLSVANGSTFPNHEAPLHWRHDRDLSGNNIMTMGIWYEALMRWVGPASTVFANAQIAVKHRKDSDGRRRAISIPDHVDVLCNLAGGGTLNMQVTTISGLTPSLDAWIFGTDGTIRIQATDFSNPGAPGLQVSHGKRGDKELKVVDIPASKQGAWRVEEEFINAIRGVEPVTHTNFTDGVKYMEWTDAVTASYQSGTLVRLPLQ